MVLPSSSGNARTTFKGASCTLSLSTVRLDATSYSKSSWSEALTRDVARADSSGAERASFRVVILSADEKTRREGRMLHRAPIEERVKTADIIDTRRSTAHRCLDHFWFDMPKNSSCGTLPQRQQSLARRNQAGHGLVQECQHHVLFVKFEGAAGEAECRAVLDNTCVRR